MRYTLVAYIPNGDSYCRGCHMGSSSSDFFMKEYSDIAAVVRQMAYYEYINTTDENYASWEYYLLVNGQDLTEFYQEPEVYGHEGYELMCALVQWAREISAVKEKAEKAKQAELTADANRKALLAKEATERRQLEELKKKYD